MLIGINEYEDEEINPLRYAVKDVKALYEVLTDPDRGRFQPSQVKLLTSDAQDVRDRPTKVNILYYLKEWLGRNVAEEDTVLIYFSGHGTVSSRDSRKFLLPMDTDLFYIPAYAIDNREFIEGIDNLKSRKVITILDSCHSGGVSRASKSIGALLPPEFYDQFESSEERVMLASSSGNQQSFEWADMEHGVFTYYLIEGLRGSANQERDYAITFHELATYVRDRVQEWADARGLKQTPISHTENVSGKIAVAFDGEAAVESAIENMKDRLRSYR